MADVLNRVGIEYLTLFAMPPVETVNLAADLGCRYISAGLTGYREFNPHNFPEFSLREDAALRREMKAAMKDRGVGISLGEGFLVRKDVEVRNYAGDLDIMAELGALRINTTSIDPDLNRTIDQCGKLAEMVGARGMTFSLEFCPGFTVPDLPTALTVLQKVGRGFQLCFDTMHFGRSGGKPADLAAVDKKLFGHVQLCDTMYTPRKPTYMEEAMWARMVPGEGELPLLDYLKHVPRNVTIGLEVPMRAEAEAGMSQIERVGRIVAGARKILERLEKEAA